MFSRVDVALAQEIIDRSPFGPWWGFTVQAVDSGAATLALPARAEFFRPGEVLQGGCAMTLADVTCWIAILSVIGPDEPAVTLNMTTAFLGAARSDLTCRSALTRTGRRTIYATATVVDSAGRDVSHHTLTYLRPGQCSTRGRSRRPGRCSG